MKPQSKPTDTRPVRLDLTQPQHEALRVMAARAGKPMSQYVRELVVRTIEKAKA